MSAEHFIDCDNGSVKPSKREHTGAGFGRKKPPQRVTVAPENKLLVSREEARPSSSILWLNRLLWLSLARAR